MVLIFGQNFEGVRLVARSLQKFYGIGPKVAEGLMARSFIHKTAKMANLADTQIKQLEAELNDMTIENALRRQMRENILRMRDIGSYRGRRHAMSLPVRGQRTKTQAKTARRLNRVDRKN